MTAARLLAAQCPDGAPPPCARPKPTSSRAVPVERTPSLTVLYLVTGPGDTTDVALADGITEELITRLSDVTGLRLTSRYAALRFRAREPADPQRVGRELGVRYVLQGAVGRVAPWQRRFHEIRFLCHWMYDRLRSDPRFQALFAETR